MLTLKDPQVIRRKDAYGMPKHDAEVCSELFMRNRDSHTLSNSAPWHKEKRHFCGLGGRRTACSGACACSGVLDPDSWECWSLAACRRVRVRKS